MSYTCISSLKQSVGKEKTVTGPILIGRSHNTHNTGTDVDDTDFSFLLTLVRKANSINGLQ